MIGSDGASQLQFRVLGPLEVCRDGEPLALGGERQRALLAVLVIRANELVAADQLVELLFRGERSESALNSLRVAMSRLRRVLARVGGDEAIVTRAGGYELRIAPEQLDAAVFQARLDDARDMLAVGDARGAATRLREGLGLWRGTPFADLSLVECVQPEIRRLEELRLAATIERIDSELALGGGGELVGELERLIAAEPLQERLRGQLMLALYRSGRQVDALAVYRQISELLRDELGLDPSSALQELERQILRRDARLDAPRRRARRAATNLPMPTTPFVGRVAELAEVTALLRGGARLLTLTGAGGSGKTRLALRAAESSVTDYPDGVWFVGFADTTDPVLIAPTIGQALKISDWPESMPINRLKTMLADLEVLLVLDNLEQLTEGTGVLAEFLAACPGLTLLVTSREPLHLAGELQYEVPVLTPDDAVALFTARAEAVAAPRVVDQALAAAICDRVDRLPLAIELAAARTKALSLSETLARLGSRLPVLTGGPRDAPRRQQTLKATIDWSYELLSPDERRLFARLAVFAGGFTLPAAEAVCAASLDTLQDLVDRSLVRPDGERYRMLQTIHEYALQRLEAAGEADDLRRAHARWFVDLLDAEGIAPPAWPGETSLDRLTPEHENFRAALEWASSIGDAETLARLAGPLSAIWVIRGQLDEATRWITLALEHEATYQPRLAAQVVSAARRLARHRGDDAKSGAFATRALELWREVGDPEAIGRAIIDLGYTRVRSGDLAAGRELLQQGVDFAREYGLSDLLAAGLNNLADLAIMQGRLDDGTELSVESLSVSDPASALADIALLNLGHVEMLNGDSENAIHSGRRALEGALRRGDLLWVAWAAIGLSWPIAAQGRLEEAARLLGAALEFLDAAGAGRDWMDEACEENVRQILRDELGDARARALLQQGRAVPLEQTAREATRTSLATGPRSLPP